MNLPKFVTTNKEGKVLGHGEHSPPPTLQSLAPWATAVYIWRLRKVGKNQFYAQVDKCNNGDKDFAPCECIKCQLAVMQTQEVNQ